MTLEAFVSYVQQTFNGLAWSFMVAWLLWVWVLVRRRDDQGGGDAGKCD